MDISQRKTRIDIWKGTESLVKYEQVERKMRIAAQIEDAMKNAGLTKTQFARLMGKYPSEITRWLSGTHNFTSDLLAEIDVALGIVREENAFVSSCSFLCDSADDNRALTISLTAKQYESLNNKARKAGKTLTQYLENLVASDVREEISRGTTRY